MEPTSNQGIHGTLSQVADIKTIVFTTNTLKSTRMQEIVMMTDFVIFPAKRFFELR
jgi:hypothetical protein